MDSPDPTHEEPNDLANAACSDGEHAHEAEVIPLSDRSNERHHRRPRPQSHRHHRPLSDYPELMTVAEAACYLRVATSTAYLLANLHLSGIGPPCMPAVRVGGSIRILRAELERIHGPK